MRKKPANYDKINTLIGRDVTIEGGTLKATETLRIDGTYIGDIICQGSICIGETGHIKGNIQAHNILVGGTVEGNISSEAETHLTHTSTVIGDITCGNFIVDEGAKLDGHCKMTSSNKNQKKEKGNDTKKN